MKQKIFETREVPKLLEWWKAAFDTSLELIFPTGTFFLELLIVMPKDLIGDLGKRSYCLTCRLMTNEYIVSGMIQ